MGHATWKREKGNRRNRLPRKWKNLKERVVKIKERDGLNLDGKQKEAARRSDNDTGRK
jgi:hypothetical protein